MRDLESERLMAQGRHPMQSGDISHVARDANIAANGRWGVLAMVAICIAADDLKKAWAWGFLLFLAYVFEQFPHPDQRRFLALCLGVNGLALLVWTWWAL